MLVTFSVLSDGVPCRQIGMLLQQAGGGKKQIVVLFPALPAV